MRFRVLFLLALVLALAYGPAASAGPAYYRLKASRPQVDSWQDGLIIAFEKDRDRCIREYGEDGWRAQCDAPYFGEESMPAEGVVMTPAVPGTWRWNNAGDSRLQFIPEKHLAPGTRYQISVKNVRLPSRVKLANPLASYTTQTQAVRLDRETVWIDPSKKAEHAVSVPMRFIWPVVTSDMEQRITITPENPQDGLAFGPLQFSWNAQKDAVVVSTRITQMPQKTARARVAVSGIPRFDDKGGKGRTIIPGTEKAASVFPVKGLAALMDVKNMTLDADNDQDLNRRLVLTITTTLRVQPSELVKNLDLLELPLKAMPTAGKPTKWASMPALNTNDIQNCRRLEPVLLTPDQPTDTVRLAIPTAPGRCIVAAVKDTATSLTG